MESSDEDLMLQYANGDENALGVIFARYKRMVFNYSYRMLANRADAEDVTSEVFCILSAKKYVRHPNAKFTTWLFTVVRNACLGRLRQKSRVVSMWFRKENSEEAEEWTVEDENPKPDELLENKVLASMVQKTLAQLPVEQREAILLREYQQLSYDEISKILNCSLEKVKILIFRARENLRKYLLPALNKESHG